MQASAAGPAWLVQFAEGVRGEQAGFLRVGCLTRVPRAVQRTCRGRAAPRCRAMRRGPGRRLRLAEHPGPRVLCLRGFHGEGPRGGGLRLSQRRAKPKARGNQRGLDVA